MKKIFVLILPVILVFGFVSCMKNTPVSSTPSCTSKPVAADSAALIKFAGDSIPLTADTTGLYYHIIDSGNSTKPTASSYLNVTYKAKLMDNFTFDSATNSYLSGATLSNLIAGWQIGLPKIGVGGHIQLFIPSALAWGCIGVVNMQSGLVTVPPDAPVFFDVQLLGIN
jgi:FKBP-type peptidyl-prolyl cis-trans isomerase FkpA